MLRFLEISQFALIDHLSIEFHEGLNLLTGETGSGKSIIVDALGLLLGEKGHLEMIRTGAERFVITGCFEASQDDRSSASPWPGLHCRPLRARERGGSTDRSR